MVIYDLPENIHCSKGTNNTIMVRPPTASVFFMFATWPVDKTLVFLEIQKFCLFMILQLSRELFRGLISLTRDYEFFQ